MIVRMHVVHHIHLLHLFAHLDVDLQTTEILHKRMKNEKIKDLRKSNDIPLLFVNYDQQRIVHRSLCNEFQILVAMGLHSLN